MRPFSGLLLTFSLLASCAADDVEQETKTTIDLTEIIVLGTIHSKHNISPDYSLKRLRLAIEQIDPDLIFVEIPPERLATAEEEFQTNGVISEKRVLLFPEYTDVIFPLSKQMKFKLIGVAAWTRTLADFRADALRNIARDSNRAAEWQEHLEAYKTYQSKVGTKAGDPLFIHSPTYDNLVRAAQKPYQTYFDKDLGAGGWTNINSAHFENIAAALDDIKGQKKRVLITFGAWHKYWLIEELSKRDDVIILDARSFFRN